LPFFIRCQRRDLLGKVVAIDPAECAMMSDRAPEIVAFADDFYSVSIGGNRSDGSVIFGGPAAHDKRVIHADAGNPK